jgi:hypothetical protein
MITSLTELFQTRFKTFYEMLDRESVFESFTKYGQGYALDSNENINIVFSLSGSISSLIQKDSNNYFSKLSAYLFSWPWFFSPPCMLKY